MNPSKLEQVARAMFEHDYGIGPKWDSMWSVWSFEYFELARAAIAAMEVPTEDKIKGAAYRYAVDKVHFDAVRNAFADGALFVRAALAEDKP